MEIYFRVGLAIENDSAYEVWVALGRVARNDLNGANEGVE